MRIVYQLDELEQILDELKAANRSIAFVPTMGALHAGHIRLIRAGKKKADQVVCSIFLNPTQFNQSEDLKKYPRTPEADAEKLAAASCDILFIPDEQTVYPHGKDVRPELDLGHYDQVLEGAFRPGHFAGVVQVVKRFLDMVKPDFLVMGQKDFQQFTIIQLMIDRLHIPTELVVVPIKREADGLAMSSRNVRLTESIRKEAVILNRTLRYAKRRLKKESIIAVKKYAINRLNTKNFKVEYFEIIDGHSLLPIEHYEDSDYVVAVTAVWAGKVRLIDNMIFKKIV